MKIVKIENYKNSRLEAQKTAPRSGSGKSQLIAEILNHFTLCTDSEVQPTTVYCYKSQVPETLSPSSSTFTYQGVPNLRALRQKLADGHKPVVLVLDDLLSGKPDNSRVPPIVDTCRHLSTPIDTCRHLSTVCTD